jgi:hypothetical protein
MEKVHFYPKENFQFYTMIFHILKKDQNIKLAINGYWVISIFEVSDCYLISPDQHVFQKFPKMAL